MKTDLRRVTPKVTAPRRTATVRAHRVVDGSPCEHSIALVSPRFVAGGSPS